MLHRGLSHAECQATVDRRPHRDLVEQAAIDPDDRDGTEITTAMDGLAQDVRTVRSHERCDLDAIDDGVEAGANVWLGPDSIDGGISTATAGQVLDPVVDIFLLEIQRHRTRRFRQANRSGTVSIAMTRSAPNRNALLMAN